MEIKISEVKQEIGKDSGNPYWRIKTNKGDMSAFDKEIGDKLFEYWQKNVFCYVDAVPSKDGKYVNIRKIFIGPEENDAFEEASKNFEATMGTPKDFYKKPEVVKLGPQDVKVFDVELSKQFNPTSMYVGYAKDICIKDERDMTPEAKMNSAINLVKQAHKEFS